MIAYKLLKVRQDGTIGPLFINCRQVIPIGKWLYRLILTHLKPRNYITNYLKWV